MDVGLVVSTSEGVPVEVELTLSNGAFVDVEARREETRVVLATSVLGGETRAVEAVELD